MEVKILCERYIHHAIKIFIGKFLPEGRLFPLWGGRAVSDTPLQPSGISISGRRYPGVRLQADKTKDNIGGQSDVYASMRYSEARAITGSSRAALRAGRYPKSSPVAEAQAKARSAGDAEKITDIPL